MSRVLGGSYARGRFLMGEVPLYSKLRYHKSDFSLCPKINQETHNDLCVQSLDTCTCDQGHTHTLELAYEPMSVPDVEPYRGTSLIRNAPLVGPYSSPLPRDLW